MLLDTGALVALLDQSEKNHQHCVNFFKDFRGEFLTTEPVLTETVYLLGSSMANQKAAVEFILKGGATLIPQSMDSLSRALDLMEKYSDVPMDLADATLVTLAEETGVHEVFTLDRRGFYAYRIRGLKAFTVWP